MIAFALVGKKQEVLDAFDKVEGTESKDKEFLAAIQKEVSDKIATLPEDHDVIGLEVKARPTKDNLNLNIFVHSRKE